MSSDKSTYISPKTAIDLVLTWSSLIKPWISEGTSYLGWPNNAKIPGGAKEAGAPSTIAKKKSVPPYPVKAPPNKGILYGCWAAAEIIFQEAVWTWYLLLFLWSNVYAPRTKFTGPSLSEINVISPCWVSVLTTENS